MCLVPRRKEPMTAKRDIVVMKYLKSNGERYCTPCQGTTVTLNATMLPNCDIPDLRPIGKDHLNTEICELYGGVIHAGITPNPMGNCCKKAIIPKGAKYWLDPAGWEIAATELYVTDESINQVDNSLYYDILENAPEINGIRIGDYQLETNEFVHPSEEMSTSNVRGIVCGFYEDGTPMVCALEILSGVWDNECDSKIGDYIENREDAIKAFNGKEVTNKYKKSKKKELKVFEKCIHYREDKNEEWFLGANGEMTTLLSNAIYLYAAHRITGLGVEIDYEGWFWSCSEYYSSYSWGCDLRSYGVYCDWDYKGYRSRVVPFFASTTTGKEKKQEKSQREAE